MDFKHEGVSSLHFEPDIARKFHDDVGFKARLKGLDRRPATVTVERFLMCHCSFVCSYLCSKAPLIRIPGQWHVYGRHGELGLGGKWREAATEIGLEVFASNLILSTDGERRGEVVEGDNGRMPVYIAEYAKAIVVQSVAKADFDTWVGRAVQEGVAGADEVEDH